jgi:hypothetical protein
VTRLSVPVLVAGVLLGSPAVWAATAGFVPGDVAAARVGLCVVAVWLAAGIGAAFVRSALGEREYPETQRPADVDP